MAAYQASEGTDINSYLEVMHAHGIRQDTMLVPDKTPQLLRRQILESVWTAVPKVVTAYQASEGTDVNSYLENMHAHGIR